MQCKEDGKPMAYVGTSVRNGLSRSIDHVSNHGIKKVSREIRNELKEAKNTKAESTTMIIRHAKEVHNGVIPKFEMNIVQQSSTDII